MTTLSQAKAAILNLHALTVGFKHGSTPDPESLLGIQADLVRLYMLLGEELAETFGQKESRYLERKIAQAKAHEHGRLQMELTGKDAEQRAVKEVEDQAKKEIEAMELYELHRAMLKSLQNSIDFARSVVSFLKTAEANAGNDQERFNSLS